MKNKAAITLVRNGTILYPLTERDYEELQAISCPITNLTIDYLPLLATMAKRYNKGIVTVPFDPIESEMLETKVLPKWKHGLTATHDAVTITYPKSESEPSVEKLLQALKRWYRKHYITFEVSVKRTSKKVTVTMRKIYGQPD